MSKFSLNTLGKLLADKSGLSQVDGDSLPKSPVNTALLLHAFRSLSQLNVPAITAVIDTLCRKYRIEEKKIEQQTPDKQFFKFDIQL